MERVLDGRKMFILSLRKLGGREQKASVITFITLEQKAFHAWFLMHSALTSFHLHGGAVKVI